MDTSSQSNATASPVTKTRIDITLLAKTRLFQGANTHEIEAMLQCLDAQPRTYSKGSYIYRMGDMPRAMGLVLKGSVRIESTDAWGATAVFAQIGPGQAFAEAYACAPGEPMEVAAVAAQDCEVLMLDVQRIINVCSKTCEHHALLIRNLLAVIARKNIGLSQRARHTAPKTIRGKVLAYLSSQASTQGSRTFDIPFDRQQLADYLCVDRSALSAELGRMKREGIIDVRKNRFVLNN